MIRGQARSIAMQWSSARSWAEIEQDQSRASYFVAVGCGEWRCEGHCLPAYRIWRVVLPLLPRNDLPRKVRRLHLLTTRMCSIG